MINAILNGILSFFTSIIDILFTPLDLAIAVLIPNSSTAFTYINQFFSMLSDYSSFAISYLGLSTEVISMAILLFIAKIMIPIVAHTFKLIAKWWEVLV